MTESQELMRRLEMLTAENRRLREQVAGMAAQGTPFASFDLVPAMMLIIDEHSAIRDANQRCLQELGYDKNEIIGRPMHCIMTPQSASRAILETISGVWRHGAVCDADCEYVKKDGTVIHAACDCIATPQPDEPNTALCVIRAVSGEKGTSEAFPLLTDQLEKSVSEEVGELPWSNLRFLREMAGRMRAEQQLRTSRSGFLDIVEKSTDGIVVLDSEGLIRYCSPSAESVLRVSEKSLIGSPFGRPLVPGTMTEIDLVRPTGEGGIAELRTEEIVWAGKNAHLALIRDITDRRRAEGKVIRQRALLKAVNLVFRETLHMCGPEEVAKACLQIAQGLTGCAYGMIGELRASGDLVPIAFSDPTVESGEPAQHGAALHDSEIQAIWKSVIRPASPSVPPKTLVPVLAVPLRRAGDTIGVIALAAKPDGFSPQDREDVEVLSPVFAEALDRSRAEHALRESEQRFRQLAGNIGEIFWLTTPDDLTRLAYVSPAHEAITGTSSSKLIGERKTDAEFIHPEDREKVIDAYQAFVEDNAGYAVEFRIVRPDGSIRWMWEKGFKVRDEAGRVSRIAGITEDITQRKRQEERQEQLVEELKNFAYIISHDLRAPLINLKGYSGELRIALEAISPVLDMGLPRISEDKRAQVIAALTEDIPEALGFIDSSVSSMEGLTNAILRLSRLGRRELRFEAVSMHALTQDVIDSSAFQNSRTQTEVEVGPLPDVVADRVCMEQILSNLISNAVKYRDPNRSALVRVTGETLHDEWVFRITDNGRGIRPADLPKIFDMFRRVGPQDVPGEGMGLAFVRTLVWRHGGRIWCESNAGGGCSFVFTIPMHLTAEIEKTREG